MKKPDPTETNIPDIFNLFYGSNPIDEFECLKENGTPIFTHEDPITMSTYPPDVLLLKLLEQQHVTMEYFTERYKDYATRVKGYHPTQISNNKSNLLKALRMGNITIKKFFEMCCILNLTPTKFHFEFENNGKPVILELNTAEGGTNHD